MKEENIGDEGGQEEELETKTRRCKRMDWKEEVREVKKKRKGGGRGKGEG